LARCALRGTGASTRCVATYESTARGEEEDMNDAIDETWEECDACGGHGGGGHDCGEDTCPCAWPIDNVTPGGGR